MIADKTRAGIVANDAVTNFSDAVTDYAFLKPADTIPDHAVADLTDAIADISKCQP